MISPGTGRTAADARTPRARRPCGRSPHPGGRSRPPAVLLGLLAAGLLALTGCADPAPTAPSPGAAASVGPAHESEAAPGVDEPDDRPVVPFAALDDDARRALLRLPASDAGGEGACGPADVRAALVFEDAALGHRYGTITITNAGAEPCSLRGYPGLGARGAYGHRFTPEVQQLPFTEGFQHGDEGAVATDLRVPAGGAAQVRIEWSGALGGAESEPLGDLVLQLHADQPPLRVEDAEREAADIGAFTSLRVGPFSLR